MTTIGHSATCPLSKEEAIKRFQSTVKEDPDNASKKRKTVKTGSVGSSAMKGSETTVCTMVVLVGIPGCGKSTFCDMLSNELTQSNCCPTRRLVQVSQDRLGCRMACEKCSEVGLRAGNHIIIDRCNFDHNQRKPWLRIGKRFGANVVAVFLNTPIETCKRRVMQRTNHPTLGPTAESMTVIENFRRKLVPPHKLEGFNTIVETVCEDIESVQAEARALAVDLVKTKRHTLAPLADDEDTGRSTLSQLTDEELIKMAENQ